MALKLCREEKREMAWRGNREHEGRLPPFPAEGYRGICDLKEYLLFN